MINLSNFQLSIFVLSILSMLFSVYVFERGKNTISLLLLIFGSLALGCFMAILDPYLNVWDESYHALVAKNMMDHPFVPVLYKTPVLDYNYQLWTDNHVWLHKQPLFLWQMALSIKVFGVNEFAVRMPSLIMHAIIPYFIFRIGEIALTRNIGYYGALFFAFAFFPLELVAGKYATDHNDLAFMFYITASFWSWFEFTSSGKKRWLVFIGLFAGSAVLVKWLMGLLVFIIWGFVLLVDWRKLFQWDRYRFALISFVVSLVVFVPWQVYILIRFPRESQFEFSGFSQHLFHAVEGHGGDVWYHFNALQVLYGKNILIPIIMILSLLLLLVKTKNKQHKIFVASAIGFVYLFYTIAQTKMIAFTIIVSPLLFLGVSVLFNSLIEFLKIKFKIKIINRSIQIALMIFVCLLFLRIDTIFAKHSIDNTKENDNRTTKLKEIAFIFSLDSLLPEKNYIVFNTNFTQAGNIPFMFYTDYIAYRAIPTKFQVQWLKDKGYKVAILDFGDLPDYVLENNEILKLKVMR